MKRSQTEGRLRRIDRLSTECSIVWLAAVLFLSSGNVSGAQQDKGADAAFKQARSVEQELADWEKWNAEQRVKTLQVLDKRRQQQTGTARQHRAFHNFQFADRHAESNIRFEARVVDDAAKNMKPVHYDHGTGMAVADVDGDGLLDIYFVSQVGGNQLWRNLGKGKFENVTATAGVGLGDRVCVTASFADVDNDGDSDLFVTTVRMGNVLFENLGNGRFKDISREAGLDYVGHSSGAVFFDFDNDGLVDLFLVNVGIYTSDKKGRGGFYLGMEDAFLAHVRPERAERSILYKNAGNKKFKDVSAEMKLMDYSWSGDATFTDLNQDYHPDLYVLNMQGDNHYYENVQGKSFVDKTCVYFPKTPWGAMGIKFFDYNLDGLMDLFITDMHSDMTDAQTKLGKQNLSADFEKQKSEAWCSVEWTESVLQGASNNVFGNAFYENKGKGVFEEVSDKVGVETYWPWGISTADLNADGYEDIFVTAGMGYPFRYGINSVLLNEFGQRFFDSEFLLRIEPRAGGRIDKDYFILDCSGEDSDHPLCRGLAGKVPVKGSLSSRSSVILDLDDDGDLDIVTNEMNDRPQVFVSNLSERKPIQFLKIKLTGAASNREGLGATVKVRAGSRTFTRYHDGKSGYLSQSSMPLYFGLGEATKVDSVEVIWPSGTKQTLKENIPVNALLRIPERPQ